MNWLRRLLGRREKPPHRDRVILALGDGYRTSYSIRQRLSGDRFWGVTYAGIIIALEDLCTSELVDTEPDRDISNADLRARGGRGRWLYQLNARGRMEYERLKAQWGESYGDQNSVE